MKVLKPWTNMEVSQNEGEFSVNVWGRKYTFFNSIFPTSILTQNEEILYSPMQLKLDFGEGEEEPYNFRYDIFEESNDKVVVLCAALCEHVILNTVVTIEYDGFIKLTLRLVPAGHNKIREWKNMEKWSNKVRLKGARLVIALKKEASTLFHYWPNSENGTVTSPNVTSGLFYETSIPFKPTVWVENEDYGLNFCMESDENIQIADKNKFITTSVRDNYHELSIQLLDSIPKQWEGREESWAMAMEPISYELMFQATPVKLYSEELKEEWRIYRTNVDQDDLEEVAKKGVKWIMFHERWSMIQNYCYPAKKEAFARNIKKAHELGMKVMLYFGYEYSTLLPDWEKKKDIYLNKNTVGTFTGGWTRPDMYQKDFIACYKGGYSDVMIENAVKAMDELGADGIYTDGTYIPWECANESHGCGYKDAEGNLHATYPILAVREHVKKLYEAVHSRNGLVDAHQSSCCVLPILSFCDTYWDGENIQSSINGSLEEHMNLDAFRCEYMGKNFGIVAQLIAYLKPPKYGIRNVLSLSLLHDVIARPLDDMEILEEISKIWKSYDDFGLRNAVWKPYWKHNSSVKAYSSDIYISSFEKEDEILAIVSKFGKGQKDTIVVPEKFTKVYEVFDDKEYDIQNGMITCKLDSATVYMFRIKA